MASPVLPRGASLRIIRIALLSGVVAFGAVVTWLVGQNGAHPSPEVRAPLQWANIALLIMSAAGVLVLQRVHAAERDPAKRQTWNVIAWALGEATAMFGGVHYLLVGSPAPYLVGLAVLVASFVLVPIRD